MPRPPPMSDSQPAAASRAVFLSYAREDTDAARRIADALRGFGVEVWFDQSELRGGDAWDQKIRKQIKDCTLFLPVISQHTQARGEGYFRLEWKLAVERTHLMAEGKPFLAPVAIDNAHEEDAIVPPEFMRVHWTRLPQGLPSPEFVEQIKRLLETQGKAPPASQGAPASSRQSSMSAGRMPALPQALGVGRRVPAAVWGAAIIVAIAVIGAIGIWQWLRRPAAESQSTQRLEAAAIPDAGAGTRPPTSEKSAPAPTTPALGEKSIAVLPFANLSSEKENEFFADGLQDDVITSLAKIRDLTVISRTSTLAYRDTAARNLKKIAGELGVATVLEGSVRRVGANVHMNAQLIDARTDAHLWANTFDGDASDSFALQASLAQKIAAALKATLTPGERTLIAQRPTQNQEAYELYSRARLLQDALSLGARQSEYEPIIALYEQAVAKDPTFALAFAQLSMVHGLMYWFPAVDPTTERRAHAEAALAVARRLAPEAPETHFAQGDFAYRCNNDWQGALAEYAVAEPGMPNDAQLQLEIGAAQRRLLQLPEALRRFERAVALNPHDFNAVLTLVQTPLNLRRYAQTKALAVRYLTVFPGQRGLRNLLQQAQYALDADYPAFVRVHADLGPTPDDPSGLSLAYRMAIFAHDLPAAERILADPRLTAPAGLAAGVALPGLPSSGGAQLNPITRQRALVAFLLGKRETAAQFAEQAIKIYRQGTLNARQQPWQLLAIAEAEALAGRADAAIRDGRAALVQFHAQDEYEARAAELRFATILLMLDRRDDALASLRSLLSQPGAAHPQLLRTDPFWSRLKDDPRFEEILKSAKVF